MPLERKRCGDPECGELVSPLGGYVRERGEDFHIACYLKPRLEAARKEGRNSILQEQEAERTRKAEAEERRAAEYVGSLFRCTRCGKKILTDDSPAVMALLRKTGEEVVSPSS